MAEEAHSWSGPLECMRPTRTGLYPAAPHACAKVGVPESSLTGALGWRDGATLKESIDAYWSLLVQHSFWYGCRPVSIDIRAGVQIGETQSAAQAPEPA